MAYAATPSIDRFWPKVDTNDRDGCWPWTGALDSKGYGRFLHERHVAAAHRVAYELLVGPIPDGLCILHHCDNPPCVRPEHLWAGTLSDNQADAVAKGRQRPWSEKGWHQLRDRK